ncbi:hypothetical protein SBADM41S_00822 [Streptomyces badius]
MAARPRPTKAIITVMTRIYTLMRERELGIETVESAW